MLVEFIGSTGAGKTTVLRNVARRLATKAETITAADLITRLVGLQGVTHPTVKNLIQEVVGFPFSICALYEYRLFVVCTVKLLLRDLRSALTTINNMRSLERKLGVYTLARRIAGEKIVFVDEGPIQAAHMFVRGDVNSNEIATFAQTVPLPDAIVYVRAPMDAIVQRTVRRSDAPREISSYLRGDLIDYVGATARLFDQLVRYLYDTTPILVVDNRDSDEEAQQLAAEMIATFIVNLRMNTASSRSSALVQA